MFLEESNESDFWTILETGMKKNASFEGDLRAKQVNEALAHLSNAATSLNLVGLKKEAKMVMVLKAECEDPATKGLDSEKMLKNLENEGIVFNVFKADDEEFEDEEDDDPLEVEDFAMPQNI